MPSLYAALPAISSRGYTTKQSASSHRVRGRSRETGGVSSGSSAAERPLRARRNGRASVLEPLTRVAAVWPPEISRAATARAVRTRLSIRKRRARRRRRSMHGLTALQLRSQSHRKYFRRCTRCRESLQDARLSTCSCSFSALRSPRSSCTSAETRYIGRDRRVAALLLRQHDAQGCLTCKAPARVGPRRVARQVDHHRAKAVTGGRGHRGGESRRKHEMAEI